MPTKEEIRAKYGISAQDFAILTQADLPNAADLQKEGAYLEKLGWWGNTEVWVRKYIITGMVTAVIFIGAFGTGLEVIAKYAPIIYANVAQTATYVSQYSHHAKDPAIGFLVHTTKPPTREDQQHQEWVIFSTGTQIYPASGAWIKG